MSQAHIAVFQESAIRRKWHQSAWWFSMIDVVGVLSASTYPNRYWSDLKRKLTQEAGSIQAYEKIVRLKLRAPDGKERETDCADTETLLRVIHSIPSPKAEPFKRWLAQVGYERIQEIEDPERASTRARVLYEAKGYPKAWIEKRLRSVAIRGELTDEWRQRGVQEGREYAILTAEIARATFGVTPGEHSAFKGLGAVKTGNNLRDQTTRFRLSIKSRSEHFGVLHSGEQANRGPAQALAGFRISIDDRRAVGLAGHLLKTGHVSIRARHR